MPETKQRRKQPSKQARQEAEKLAYLRKQRRRNRRVTIVAVIAALGMGTIGILSFIEPPDDSPQVDASSSPSSTAPPTTADPASVCPRPDGSSARQMSWPAAPPVCINPARSYQAEIETDVGTFTIELDNKNAPQTVNNFVFLSRYHFYDGLTFHKSKPGFVIQTGDPPDKGVTNAGYVFNDENIPVGQRYVAGDVIMAKDKPNTNGSQFLVITGLEGESLPTQFSRFGRVVKGQDVVGQIDRDGCVGETCKDLTPTRIHAIRRITIIER